MQAIAAAWRAWQEADDHLRGAVQRAREAGDPWGLIALMLLVDEQDAVRRYAGPGR